MVPEDWTQFSKSCTCDFSCCRSMADTKAKITEAVKPLTAELNFIAFTVQVKAGWGLTSCIPDHRDSRNMECSEQELLLICAVNFYLTCKSSFTVTHICGCFTPHLYFTGEDLEAHGRKTPRSSSPFHICIVVWMDLLNSNPHYVIIFCLVK